ncbi:MAG: tRNA-dihydrouridine synthase 3 [Vezdaea aestivalis]|nr:MAG: tRNA-dihydrouridine synthase 3 [Vezdaea aestivalis]
MEISLPPPTPSTRARETHDDFGASPAKRQKVINGDAIKQGEVVTVSTTVRNTAKGIAPIKAEYLLNPPGSHTNGKVSKGDDDAAGAVGHDSRQEKKGRERSKGQNTARDFGNWQDKLLLCATRATAPEFSPPPCKFGDKCKFEHDLRKYLAEGKNEDLKTFEKDLCPNWDTYGTCEAGWKCRWVSSHMEERIEDGKSELVLTEDETRIRDAEKRNLSPGIVNLVTAQNKADLKKKHFKLPRSASYLRTQETRNEAQKPIKDSSESTESALLPPEKRRLYFGPDTPALAPLTTQGNLPFRRLCIDLGAQLTYSEMAMSMPLLQGLKSEWTLLKAHRSELAPPSTTLPLPQSYVTSIDMRFGAQISGNKVPVALQATEAITTLCPHLRLVDLNCGCPIDMVFQSGAGAGLLKNPSRIEKLLRGMNAVSGPVPITVKIRTGVNRDQPTAEKLLRRLCLGAEDSTLPSSGVSGAAAVTLHGRTRAQRYTKSADWEYIGTCAALIKTLKAEKDATTDTVREIDARYLPATNDGMPWFIGNGDVYSHEDYFAHLEDAKVDGVMVARGALIKPWVFEEIQAGQHLDVPATKRLEYVKQYVKYGLDTWGSDEIGVGLTRRFLLEWLSFAHRYVPVGLLERLPPNIQDRPPAFRGRNELETLLAGDHFTDWVKISEMFLGRAHDNFRFEPKHKSNSYEIQAEG